MSDDRFITKDFKEEFVKEWALVTKLVRLKAARRGKDLKKIVIVEKR